MGGFVVGCEGVGTGVGRGEVGAFIIFGKVGGRANVGDCVGFVGLGS